MTNLLLAGVDSRPSGSVTGGSGMTSGVANPTIMTPMTCVFGTITPWTLTPIRMTSTISASASTVPLTSVVVSAAVPTD